MRDRAFVHNLAHISDKQWSDPHKKFNTNASLESEVSAKYCNSFGPDSLFGIPDADSESGLDSTWPRSAISECCCNYTLLMTTFWFTGTLSELTQFAWCKTIFSLTLSLTVVIKPNFQSGFIRWIVVVLSNGTLLSNKSGSIKERTQTIDSYIL